jgi:EAL domain-containing protein (putative c-di-GMP-specific phosphodiesterase class I)
VAQGIETEDEAKMLRLLRCDRMQGYLKSKPVPESELRKFCAGLRRNARPCVRAFLELAA